MTGTMTQAEPGAKQRAARERCDAMVRHAREQIMAVGVDRFSLNEVLRRSGGSKATLAKYFGGRDGLIGAAIGHEAHQAVARLELASVNSLPLGEALTRVLEGILRFYLLPGSVALYRAVVSAADPRGSEAFYRHGHDVIVQAVASVLDARKGRDVAPEVDASEVAGLLLHAIRAGTFERALIGLGDDREGDDLTRQVAATVRLVLPGLHPRSA